MPQGDRPLRRLVVKQGLSRVRIASQAGLETPAMIVAPGSQKSRLECTGDVVQIRVGHGWPWEKAGATLLLDPQFSWELSASGGLSNVVAALEDVHVTSITLSGGASNVELTLGHPRGVCPLRLSGGAHHLVVRRPKEVGVRLALRGGVAHLALDDFFFGAAGGKVRMDTPNCATAADRYELELSGGASHLQIC